MKNNVCQVSRALTHSLASFLLLPLQFSISSYLSRFIVSWDCRPAPDGFIRTFLAFWHIWLITARRQFSTAPQLAHGQFWKDKCVFYVKKMYFFICFPPSPTTSVHYLEHKRTHLSVITNERQRHSTGLLNRKRCWKPLSYFPVHHFINNLCKQNNILVHITADFIK